MNKYVMNEESKELFSSMHDKFEEIESSHGTISDARSAALKTHTTVLKRLKTA